MVLTLIRLWLQGKHLWIACQLYLYALFPMFIAQDHTNYAQYVPVLLITLIDLSDTNRRCKKLLEQNEFSVSQSLVFCLRNAFDLTIRQTINLVPSQRRYYRLQF